MRDRRLPKTPPTPPPALSLTELDNGPTKGKVLCRLDDIDDGGSQTFTYKKGTWRFEVFLQRKGDNVYAYENTCPHVGLPLNLRPNKFLDMDGEALLCVNHAAYFNIEDGLCFKGPCKGRWLIPIAIELQDGNILVA